MSGSTRFEIGDFRNFLRFKINNETDYALHVQVGRNHFDEIVISIKKEEPKVEQNPKPE